MFNLVLEHFAIFLPLQAKLNFDLFSLVSDLMSALFYYFYHRIAKNTSIELTVGLNLCFMVSFEFIEYWVILGIFARFMAENINYSLRDLGRSDPDLRHVFCPARFFVRPLKICTK